MFTEVRKRLAAIALRQGVITEDERAQLVLAEERMERVYQLARLRSHQIGGTRARREVGHGDA